MKRETCEKNAIISSGFDVLETSNFGPRTLAHLARPAQLSHGEGLLCVTL